MKVKIILFAMLALCLTMSVSAQNEKRATKSKSNITNNRASVEQYLIDGEKAAWKNLVEKKYDEFAKLLADDYQGLYPTGLTTKDAELAEVRKTTFKSADVSDVKVKWVDENTAIVTAAVKAVLVGADGKDMNISSRTVSVVAKRANQWLCVFHADVMEGAGM